MKLNSIILLIPAVLLFSCTSGTFINSGNKSFKTQLDILVDSMSVSWNTMESSDANKISGLKRILDELSYAEKVNNVEMESILNSYQKVVISKLNPTDMTDEKIDEYDRLSDILIKKVFHLIDSLPDTENYPIIASLKSDISKADENLVIYRYKYDKWANQYNKKIEGKEKKLRKMGSPYNQYKKRKLFAIQ
ncbi:MAG: hypothetical protein ACK40G_01975 [Cytophagaceae bacterium]